MQRLPREVAHLVEIGREEEEGGECGGTDRVALGQCLRRVADRVESVRLLTYRLRLARHLDDAACVVRDRAEDVHREDVAGRAEHAHGGDGRAEQAADGHTGLIQQAARLTKRVAGDDRGANRQHRQHRGLHADRETGDDVRGRTGEAGLGDAQHRAVAVLRVVLRDEDEEDRRHDADHAAEEVVPPRIGGVGDLEQRAAGEEEDHGDERRGDVVAEVERLHGVGVLLRLDDHHADDRADQPERHDDEREEDAVDAEGAVEQHAKDHGADILGGGAFEQVGTTASAVADVVAHEIGDHGGITRIVFRNARLDLADEIGTDVSGLRIDATAELGEQRDERRAESVADDQEGDVLGPFGLAHPIGCQGGQYSEEAADAEQAHRDCEQP